MSTDDRSEAPPAGPPAADHPATPHYEIRVRGRLGARWSAWFDGMTLAAGDDGTTVIRGPVADQAALHGQLQKLRDLGLTLLSLTGDAPATSVERPDPPHVHTPHQPTHQDQPGARP